MANIRHVKPRIGVPADWDDTRIVAAEPGDYLTTVRRAKGKDEWYLGSITGENVRQ